MRKNGFLILIVVLLILSALGLSACGEGKSVTYIDSEAYDYFSTVINELNTVVAFSYDLTVSGNYKGQITDTYSAKIAKNISSHNFQYSEEADFFDKDGNAKNFRRIYYRNGRLFLYNDQNKLTSYDADKETLAVYDVKVDRKAGLNITADQIKSINYTSPNFTITLKTAGNLVELYSLLGINLLPFGISEPREIEGEENHITIFVHHNASNVIDSISFHLIGQEVNDRFEMEYKIDFKNFASSLSDTNFPSDISTALHVASSLPPIIEPISALAVQSAVDKANTNFNFEKTLSAKWISGESVWASMIETKQKARVSAKAQTYVFGNVNNKRINTIFSYAYASRDDKIYEKTYSGSVSEYLAFNATEERYNKHGIFSDETLLTLPVTINDFEALLPYTVDGVPTFRAQLSGLKAKEIFNTFGFERNLFAGFNEAFNFERLVITFTLDNNGAVKTADYIFYINNNNVTSELSVKIDVLKSSIGNVSIPSEMTAGIVIKDNYLSQPSSVLNANEDVSFVKSSGNEIFVIDQKNIGRYALAVINGDNLSISDYESFPDQFYVSGLFASGSDIYILGAQTTIVDSTTAVKSNVLYRYDSIIKDIVDRYVLPAAFSSFAVYNFGNDRILYGVRNENVSKKLASVNLSNLALSEYGTDTLQTSAKVTLFKDILYIHGDGYSFFKMNLNSNSPVPSENYTSHMLKGANAIVVTQDKIWGAGRVYRSSTFSEIVSDSSVCGYDTDGKIKGATDFYCISGGILLSDIGLVESVSRNAFLLLDNTFKGAFALSNGKVFYWKKSGTNFGLYGFENVSAKNLSFVGAVDNDVPKEEPVSIEVYSALKTVYEIGENREEIKIKINFNTENRFQIITASLDMVTGFNTGSAGEKTAVITYRNKSVNWNYTVNSRTVDNIEIVDGSFKTSYEIREKLNLSSAKILVTFNNTQTVFVNITEDMVSGFNSEVDGARSITVTYAGKTATHAYSVSYTADTVMDIELVEPLLSVYYYLEDLPWDKLKLNVTYYQQASSVEVVTPSMISGFNTQSVGNKTLTVSYAGLSFTHEYLVCYKVDTVAIKADSFKAKYNYNETVDLSSAYFVVKFFNIANSSEFPISGAMLANFDTHQPEGSYTATVTFTAFDGKTYPLYYTYSVLKDELGVLSVEIESGSFNSYYWQGAGLDLSNAKYTVHHFNGSTTTGCAISEAQLSGFDTATLGNKTLTLTVDNVSATFIFTVVKKPTAILIMKNAEVVSSIFAPNYYRAQEITLAEIISGANFALSFSDGTTSLYNSITEAMISGFSTENKGHFFATINYTYTDAVASLSETLSLSQPYDILNHAKTVISMSVGMLVAETPVRYDGAFPASYTHNGTIDLTNAYLTLNNFDSTVSYVSVNSALSSGSLSIRDFNNLLINYPVTNASLDFTYTDPYNDTDNVHTFSIPFEITPSDNTVVSLALSGTLNGTDISLNPELLILSDIPTSLVGENNCLEGVNLVLVTHGSGLEEIPLRLSWISGLDTSVSGTFTATVSYTIYGGTLSVDFNYYIRNVTEINWKDGDPFLSVYEVGDVIELNGLVVVATTINGIGQTVYVDIPYSGGEISVTGATTAEPSDSSIIQVTYSNRSLSHSFKVIKKISSIAFESGAIKPRYYLNELGGITYPLNNKKIIVTYTDMTEEALVFMAGGSAVQNFSISGALVTDTMLLDSGNVTVTYLNKYSASFNYGVLPRVTGVSIASGFFKSDYYWNEPIANLAGATLNVAYTIGSEAYLTHYSEYLPTSVAITETMLYFGSNVLAGLSAITGTSHGNLVLSVKYDYTEDVAASKTATVSYNVNPVVNAVAAPAGATKFPASFDWGTFTHFNIGELKSYQIFVTYSDNSSAYIDYGTEVTDGICANVIFSETLVSDKKSPELVFSPNVGEHEVYVWYKDPLTNSYYNHKLVYTVNNTVEKINLTSTIAKYPHKADLNGVVIAKMVVVYKDGSQDLPLDIFSTGATNVTVSGLNLDTVTLEGVTRETTITYTYKQGLSVSASYSYSVARMVSSVLAAAPLNGYNYKQFINAGVSVYEAEEYGKVNVTYSTGETLADVAVSYAMLSGFSLETVGTGFTGTITYQGNPFWWGGVLASDSASVNFNYSVSAYDTGNYTVKYVGENTSYLYDHQPSNLSAVYASVTIVRHNSDGTTAEIAVQSSNTSIFVYEAFTSPRLKSFLYSYTDRAGATQTATVKFFYLVKKVPVSIVFNASAFLGSYPNNTNYVSITENLIPSNLLITYSDGSEGNPSSINHSEFRYDDTSSVTREYTNSDNFTANVSFKQLKIYYDYMYVLADGTPAAAPITALSTVEINPADDFVIGISLGAGSFNDNYEYESTIAFNAGAEINVHYYNSTMFINIYPCTGAVLSASSTISNYQISSGAVPAPAENLYDLVNNKFIGSVTYEGFSVDFKYTVTATPVYSVDLANLEIKGLICADPSHAHTAACYQNVLSTEYIAENVYTIGVTLAETISGVRLKGTYQDRAANDNTYQDISNLVILSRDKHTVKGVSDYVDTSTNVYADFAGSERTVNVNFSGKNYAVFNYVRAYNAYTPLSFTLNSVTPAVTQDVGGNWYFKEGESLSNYNSNVTINFKSAASASYTLILSDLVKDYNFTASETVKTLTLSPVDLLTQTQNYYVVTLPKAIYVVKNTVTPATFTENDKEQGIYINEGGNFDETYSAMLEYPDGTFVKVNISSLSFYSDTLESINYNDFINYQNAFLKHMILGYTSSLNEISFTKYAELIMFFVIPISPMSMELTGRTAYALGESLDINSYTLGVRYFDISNEVDFLGAQSVLNFDLSCMTVSGFNTSSIGTYTMKIAYKGAVCTFEYTVSESTAEFYDNLTSATALPINASVMVGENIDLSNIIIKVGGVNTSVNPIDCIKVNIGGTDYFGRSALREMVKAEGSYAANLIYLSQTLALNLTVNANTNTVKLYNGATEIVEGSGIAIGLITNTKVKADGTSFLDGIRFEINGVSVLATSDMFDIATNTLSYQGRSEVLTFNYTAPYKVEFILGKKVMYDTVMYQSDLSGGGTLRNLFTEYYTVSEPNRLYKYYFRVYSAESVYFDVPVVKDMLSAETGTIGEAGSRTVNAVYSTLTVKTTETVYQYVRFYSGATLCYSIMNDTLNYHGTPLSLNTTVNGNVDLSSFSVKVNDGSGEISYSLSDYISFVYKGSGATKEITDIKLQDGIWQKNSFEAGTWSNYVCEFNSDAQQLNKLALNAGTYTICFAFLNKTIELNLTVA